ncbi:hypothetical protein [Acinetobacter larvae]|uniref:hypothetical protein n=1 Tax=Acinetobacter larvae TaxID=1789224 RepID=UPI000901396B|nr:hypothetical protein [Acinetobacter larvae]
MQYRCPQCQSPKIMPMANNQNPAARPEVPKSLVMLIPALFILLFLVVVSIGMWIFGNGPGTTLQNATIIVFVIAVIAGFFFWRDLPNFKLSMQAFMNNNRDWKCRDCQHEWHI